MKILLFAAILMLVAGCADVQPPIPPVSGFQLDRYLGKWYEIARLPNAFEKDLQFVTAHYFRDRQGRIRVRNEGIKNGKRTSITGFARLAGGTDTGDLQVSFFRPFYSPYRIIRLSPDYSTACVMGKDHSLAWILARTPTIPDAKKEILMDFLRQKGFAVEKLIYPQQTP